MDSFTSDAPHDSGRCRKGSGLRRNTRPSGASPRRWTPQTAPCKAGACSPAANERDADHGRGSRPPPPTPAPAPMPRDGKPVTGAPPNRRTTGVADSAVPPRSHVQGVAGCAGAGREAGAGQEGEEEEETMHEASPRGGASGAGRRPEGPVAPWAGAGDHPGPDTQGGEEEETHARGVPTRGEQVGNAEGRRARPLLGPEPVTTQDRIRREGEEEGNHARGVPARGSRWSRPKAGGSGPSLRTPATRLRRCRPTRMTSQEANPC